MAIVPRAKHQVGAHGARKVIPIPKLVAPQTGIAALGKGLADIGAAINTWEDSIATADAKNADTGFSDDVRKLLYEDGEGFMNRMGNNAITTREEAVSTLEQQKQARLEGLSGMARKKASASLDRRYQSALERMDRHTSGQRRTYLNDATNARVGAAVNDAIYDPEKVGENIKLITTEIKDAAARNGSPPEVVQKELAQAQTLIHSGVVKRLEAADPVTAMRYLQDNKTKMLGSEVAKLTATLAPKMREYKGRQAGRVIFSQGDQSGSKMPRSVANLDSYLRSIRAAESGGNDRAKNPTSSATGRYQFIASTWNQLRINHPELGLTKNGRFDPAQQERAIRQFTADNARSLEKAGISATNGNLYAAHFLGAGGAKKVLLSPDNASVAGIVGADVMKANSFLKGMTVANFRAWANKKGNGKGGSVGRDAQASSPLDRILAISDPDERDAALREYKLLAANRDAKQQQRHGAASDRAFQIIEAGGNVDDLSLDDRQYLGREEMSALRSYQDKRDNDEKIVTDPKLYMQLSRIAAEEPDGFTKLNSMAWIDKLDKGDFEKFVDLQRTIRTAGIEEAAKKTVAVDPPTVSAIRSATSTQLAAVGIRLKDDAGAAKAAQFERQMIQWADNFTSQNNAKPTAKDINLKAGQLLTSVSLDSEGFADHNNFDDKRAFEINYEGKPLDKDDNITLDDVRGADIEINGTEVPENMLGNFIAGFQEAMDRDPTAEEVVNGLIESGLF